jgi:MFS transporter, DHA2 family, multidrug resistance protein
MAVWGTGTILGPVIGPALGDWLTDDYNWRWVFGVEARAVLHCNPADATQSPPMQEEGEA